MTLSLLSPAVKSKIAWLSTEAEAHNEEAKACKELLILAGKLNETTYGVLSSSDSSYSLKSPHDHDHDSDSDSSSISSASTGTCALSVCSEAVSISGRSSIRSVRALGEHLATRKSSLHLPRSISRAEQWLNSSARSMSVGNEVLTLRSSTVKLSASEHILTSRPSDASTVRDSE